MEFQVSVPYLGAQAHYKIIPEEKNIYYAELTKYEGGPDYGPPENILLVKGVTRWLGSEDELTLLNELGQLIEQHMQSEDFIFYRRNRGLFAS